MHDRHAILTLLKNAASSYLPQLLLALVLLLANTAATLAYPWIISLFVGHFSVNGINFLGTQTLIFLLLLALTTTTLASYVSSIILANVSEKISFKLRNDVVAAYLDTKPAHFRFFSHGQQLSRIGNDTNMIGGFIGNMMPAAIPPLLTGLGAIIILSGKNALLGALTIASVIPATFLVLGMRKRLKQKSGDYLKQYGDMLDTANTLISWLPLYKAFVCEEPARNRFRVSNTRYLESSLDYNKLSLSLQPLTRLTVLIFLFLSVYLAITLSLYVPQNAAEAVATLLYMAYAIRPITLASRLYGSYQNTSAASQRILEHLNGPMETPNRKEHVATSTSEDRKDSSRYVIRLSDASFSHAADSVKLLDNVNLDIKSGETILIHGPNGQGKTTLLYILLRFLSLSEGSLAINGKNCDDISLSQWRSLFGYVPQFSTAYGLSLRESLTLGRDIQDAKILQYSEVVNAHDNIKELPLGLDTPIDEYGTRLSGGQLQRLSLLRAIIGDPPFLLLDEVTSMLDSENVSLFIKNYKNITSDSGVIIISHDKILRQIADHSYTLKNGRIHKDQDLYKPS